MGDVRPAGVDRAELRQVCRVGGFGTVFTSRSSGTNAKANAMPLLLKRIRAKSATNTFGPAVPAASVPDQGLDRRPSWPSGHLSPFSNVLPLLSPSAGSVGSSIFAEDTSSPVCAKKSLSRALRPVVAVWNGWMWMTPSWWVWMPPGSGETPTLMLGRYWSQM